MDGDDDRSEREASVAMAWYTPEAWRELQALPEAQIEMTYSEHLRKCERIIATDLRSGHVIEHVVGGECRCRAAAACTHGAKALLKRRHSAASATIR
jgi:hypothetical protein